MPILLDTPFSFDPGFGHPVEVYTHVNMMRFEIDRRIGRLKCEFDYGTYNGATFLPGKAEPLLRVVKDVDGQIAFNPDTQEWDTIDPFPEFTLLIVANYATWADAGTALYQLIIDDGKIEGTIVPDPTE